MQWIRLAHIDDFEHRVIKSYSVAGRKIGIVRRDNGEFYAIEVGCKHQGADLTMGRLKETVLTCPRHGWQYDIENGHCINHVSNPLRKHGCRVTETGEIEVTMTPLETE